MARHAAKTNTFASTSAKVALTGAILGAGAAIFAPTASAAPDSDWDRLAQCESGGNWHINTGTATTAVCSSPQAPGTLSVVTSSLRPLIRLPASSRFTLLRRSWLSRVGAHGRLAPQAWVSPPARPIVRTRARAPLLFAHRPLRQLLLPTPRLTWSSSSLTACPTSTACPTLRHSSLSSVH